MVIEWKQDRDDVLFWKWRGAAITKNDKLLVKSGQIAVLQGNGRMVGIFDNPGTYELESFIEPLKKEAGGSFFNIGVDKLKLEVFFMHMDEFTVRWGTKAPIAISAGDSAEGLKIRAFGHFRAKITDFAVMKELLIGDDKERYTTGNLQDDLMGRISQLLMKWLPRAGNTLPQLQGGAEWVASNMKDDLDYELVKKGISVLDVTIESLTMPQPSTWTNPYSKIGGTSSGTSHGNTAGWTTYHGGQTSGAPKYAFCPACGTKLNGARYCPQCGRKAE